MNTFNVKAQAVEIMSHPDGHLLLQFDAAVEDLLEEIGLDAVMNYWHLTREIRTRR